MSKPRMRAALPAALILATLALGACGDKAAAPAAPPAAAVTVVTLASAPVTLTRELTGRAEASQQAEVRPQASGIVEKRLFTEGGAVKAGETLYELDDATYKADANSARAALARAQATLKSAQLTAARIAELAAIDAVSA